MVRVLAALVTKKGGQFSRSPLFAWCKGSTRFGEGVTYARIMEVVRAGADLCGRNIKEYGSHRLRRGGANEYILAGMCQRFEPLNPDLAYKLKASVYG